MNSVLKYLMPFIFSLTAAAQAAGTNSTSSSESGNCLECSLPPGSLSKEASSSREIRNLVANGSEAQSVAEVSSRMNWSEGCSRFAEGNSYGPWGRLVIRELESNNYDELMRGTADLRERCPGYDSMSREAKHGLWVTILAAMSNHESSCRPNPPLHGGPNGTLVGVLQLHLGKEHRYSPDCVPNAGRKAETSIQCAMSMMNAQVGKYGDLFSNSAYWEVLQPKSRKKIYREIQEAIENYNLCR